MQQHEIYYSGVFALILLNKSLLGALDNPLMLWVMSKDPSFALLFPATQCCTIVKEGEGAGVGNRMIQILISSFKIFICNVTG